MHASVRPRREVRARFAGVQYMPPSAADELELAPTESTRSDGQTRANNQTRTRTQAHANVQTCAIGQSRTHTRTRTRRVARVAATVALSALLALALAGCRDTDVLTETIIGEPYEYPVDESLDPQIVPQEAAPTKFGETVDGQSEQPDPNPDGADYTPDDPNRPDETTARQNQSENDSNAPASQGRTGNEGDRESDTPNGAGSSSPDEEGSQGRKGATITIDPSADNPDDSSTAPSDDGQSGSGSTVAPWNPGQSGNGSGDGGQSGATYNNGTYSQLPQNVGKIAAAGPYATIVQSIGGPGALAAAPQQWLDSLPAAAYSDGAELADVRGVPEWGDGTAMTQEAAQAIIDSGAEVVLTSNSYGGIVTDEQAAWFTEAGVDVVVMPTIGVPDAVDADISMTVQVVGELLKDSGLTLVGGRSPKQMANEWVAQHDGALNATLSANGGFTVAPYKAYVYQGTVSQASANQVANVSQNRLYAVYIDEWRSAQDLQASARYDADPDVMARLNSNALRNGERTNNISDLYIASGAQLEGAYDLRSGYGRTNLTPGSGSSASGFDLNSYYFQLAGVEDSHLGYVSVGGGRGRGSVMVLTSDRIIGVNKVFPALEGRTMPGIEVPIARDAEIAQAIADNATSYDPAYGVYGSYNVSVQTSLLKIWIMPASLISGSWNDGTFESFLEAPWAYGMARSEGSTFNDTSFADGYVNDFYGMFYRCGAAGLLEGYGQAVTVTY